RYPVGRYPAYRRCVNRPAYTQSSLYWGYPLIPDFVRQRSIATDPESAQRLYHIWPDLPGYSTADAV
ncbi:MAG TPA: hypothetical protein VN370_03240, partial [Desulfitobacteriaceae bacterium]|nr:hypothetical protein [Desulfitobacteriaceae bacterium]